MRVLVFAEVNRFLVQRPIEQLEILQTSHFFWSPEPILSNADVLQRILDPVVA